MWKELILKNIDSERNGIKMLTESHDISIVGIQHYDDTSGEIALNTTGSYEKKGDSRLISYNEYDEDNPNISHISYIEIKKNVVTMSKKDSATKLILEIGRRNICLYDTGFGSMALGVFASEINSSLDDFGGELIVKYTLDVDSNLSSRNEVKINVSPRKL